jgi:allophanate hydrolase
MMKTPLTIETLLSGYQSGEIKVAEFLSQQLALVKQDNHNAWISTLSEKQLAGYIARLEAHSPQDLPLYGVPFAIKDNIDLVGLNTTAGCPDFSYQPEQSAFVVDQLIAAGAVPMGKTNLDQFATGLVGTRSPWGAVKNSFDPSYVSGGSSSGSAVSVALNQVYFSLGTDTAGSGRVPAAFNNLVGLKPTRGTLSCSGLVPACKSLDCITFFGRTAKDVELLYQVAAVYDPADCYARPVISKSSKKTRFSGINVGVPKPHQLAFFGNDEYQAQFDKAIEQVKSLGGNIVEIDFEPFLSAARLLYQGPWVAERYAAIQAFFDQDSGRCLPVIETIVGGAKSFDAADTFKAMYQLQHYKVICDKLVKSVDVILTPTAGSTYTIDEVNANPIELNSNLGYYTNFMNLLDYSAIAIPSGFGTQGRPFGVTLFSLAFADMDLLSLADEWQQSLNLPLGATGERILPLDNVDLLVCGAHMQGLPLNHQLTQVNGYFKQATKTAKAYKFYALAGGPPYRPGLVRHENGEAIEVEIWSVPKSEIGRLLMQIPHPLGLGSIELMSGEWVKGFICEPIGIEGAKDISPLGGWRNFIAQL